MLLFIISFIAGILTVLAPCVLPLLPVIVGGSLAGERSLLRAYRICLSLGASVVLFTILLKVSTAFIEIPQYVWQHLSGGIIVLFGITLLFPRLWDSLGFARWLNRGSNRVLASGYQKQSAWGDMLMGAALGPVFASCSPTYFIVLATVLPANFWMGLADLLAYAAGLSGFLFLIALGGQRIVDRLGITIDPSGWFRKSIGLLFVIVGLLVATGTEAKIERYLLERGFDVTRIEQMLLGANSAAPGPKATLPADQKSLVYKKAPELASIEGYINTAGQPITISEFTGNKVVLIDFWTYSCINCQRTLPYLKAWYEKYREDGLEIIGVHTPEFAFERVLSNVQRATNEFGLTYPIVLDNSYGTWNAFGNQFWPRKYLIDIDGYIVFDHAGEGSYPETEAAIQKALMERAERLGTSTPAGGVAAPKGTIQAASSLGSPETYFGANRNQLLGNGTPGVVGKIFFEEPLSVVRNALYLIGPWMIAPEYAEVSSSVGGSAGSARIDYRYYAKAVYLVAGSATKAPIEIEVMRNSKPLEKAYAGEDVYYKNARSYISVSEERLYKVIEDVSVGEHFIEFIIDTPGLRAYTFTFG